MLKQAALSKEIYARPFEERYYTAAHNIGRMSMRGAAIENLRSLEKRRYDELTSGLVEALQGVVSTHYTFELKNGRLVAEDGEPISDMLRRAYVNDLELAEKDEFYAQFLPQRSAHELAELHEQEAMAKGQTDFNTIITFSPYSEEFDTSIENHQKLKKAKQKPHWKRAMIRISHWDGQKLHVSTRSLDNSDLGLLHETASSYFGYQFRAQDSTETLGERLHLKADTKLVALMPDAICRVADSIMSERRGGEWRQGRSKEEAKDLKIFVESHAGIIKKLLKVGRELARKHMDFESYEKAYDEQIYNYAALLELRLERRASGKILDMPAASKAAGNLARAEGKTFDMCGKALEPEADATKKTGFESLLRLEGQPVSCPNCDKKVVVDKEYLEKGELQCSECGYHIDVCTGKKGFRKANKRTQEKKEDFADLLKKAFKL
ncbi:MAG TPA: hypothetical protein VFB03_03745 [Candidatus Saccharimonadales bacterium]|nr:hypothetical protein [Candidatus Saccharimonadales bacterium]